MKRLGKWVAAISASLATLYLCWFWPLPNNQKPRAVLRLAMGSPSPSGLKMNEIMDLKVELEFGEISIEDLVVHIIENVSAQNAGIGLSIYFSTRENVVDTPVNIPRGRYTVKHLIETISNVTGVRHRITDGGVYFE